MLTNSTNIANPRKNIHVVYSKFTKNDYFTQIPYDMKKKKTKERRKYNSEHREEARKLYLRGLFLPEISKLMDIPKRTLEKWQLTEKWTLLKECPEVKKRAYDLKQSGYTTKKIAEMLDVSTVTVWRYIKAYEKEKTK